MLFDVICTMSISQIGNMMKHDEILWNIVFENRCFSVPSCAVLRSCSSTASGLWRTDPTWSNCFFVFQPPWAKLMPARQGGHRHTVMYHFMVQFDPSALRRVVIAKSREWWILNIILEGCWLLGWVFSDGTSFCMKLYHCANVGSTIVNPPIFFRGVRFAIVNSRSQLSPQIKKTNQNHSTTI